MQNQTEPVIELMINKVVSDYNMSVPFQWKCVLLKSKIK